MTSFFKKKKQEPIERYEPDLKIGLLKNQVNNRKQLKLFNISKEHTQKTYGQIFLSNIFTLFNCVLYSVAAIYIAAIIYQNSLPYDVQLAIYNSGNTMGTTSLLFLLALLFNIAIGIYQECKAKASVERLKLLDKQNCTVLRDGKKMSIPYTSIVLDDIVIFKSGNSITVDGPVVQGSCTVNESVLTGESHGIVKNLGDILHAGSVVISGEVFVRADKIGENTSTSQLKREVTEVKRKKSQLLKYLSRIIRYLTIILIPIILMTSIKQFSINYSNLTNSDQTLQAPALMHLAQSMGSTVIGAIPTGLLVLSSISLASSTLKLSKIKVIVRDLYSVENLSRVDTICFDKTGTLTESALQVEKTVNLKKMKDDELYKLLGSYVHALPVDNDTSVALNKKFVENGRYHIESIKPFQSDTKRTEVVLKSEGEKEIVYEMGAPDFLFGKDAEIMTTVNSYARKGYRIVGFGRQEEKGVEPLALIIISDKLRPSIQETISYFNKNNIGIRVISGDSPETVSSIAEKAGIKNADRAISMENVPDDKIMDLVKEYTIFSRVTPEQKKLIIEALQKYGHSVAYVGDGINDILALTAANASMTFGSATDAAKQVSDIVIVDNDFNHCPSIVNEGRRSINNLSRVAVLYLMKSFFTLGYQLCSLAIGDPYLIFQQLFFINEGFISGFAGLFLALERNYNKYEGNFMTNVMSKALPAAAYLLISILICHVLIATGLMRDDVTIYEADATLLFSIAGFAVFFKQCSPFNLYRSTVFAITLMATAVGVIFFPQLLLEGESFETSGEGIITFFTSGFYLSNNMIFNGTLTITDFAIIGIFGALSIPLYYLVYNIINMAMNSFKKHMAE